MANHWREDPARPSRTPGRRTGRTSQPRASRSRADQPRTQGRHLGAHPTQDRDRSTARRADTPSRGRGQGASRQSAAQGRRAVSMGPGRAGTGAARRRSSRVPHGAPSAPKVVIGLIVLALAAIAVVAFVVVPRCSGGGDGQTVASGESVQVTIPEGASGDAIVEELQSKGLIDNAREYYKLASQMGADQKIQPGTYEFKVGTSMGDIIRQLMEGPNTTTNRLTVPEGLTVAKTAEAVEKALGIPADDFIAQAKASNYVDDYPFLKEAADDSLEGYLWAKTYDFSGKEVTADTVIRAMLDQFSEEQTALGFGAGIKRVNQEYGLSMDEYSILKLASVIEREAYSEDDRPLVASVFYNRLRQDMPLQSDATSEYAKGSAITADDLKEQNPYNSYLNKGLPPTPICTPSEACIKAALDPAQTDYLYFLLIEDGSYSNHTFSKTYEEHLQAIEKAKADQASS